MRETRTLLVCSTGYEKYDNDTPSAKKKPSQTAAVHEGKRGIHYPDEKLSIIGPALPMLVSLSPCGVLCQLASCWTHPGSLGHNEPTTFFRAPSISSLQKEVGTPAFISLKGVGKGDKCRVSGLPSASNDAGLLWRTSECRRCRL